MQQFITGIQQAGIGVQDACAAKYLYRDLFGMNVLLFDDVADASLMQKYTGNEIHRRRAILSLNMQGGGGFEIWQFTSRKPVECYNQTAFGDIGIFGIKLKSSNIKSSYAALSNNPQVTVSSLFIAPDNATHFWARDAYGNNFNIVESPQSFKNNGSLSGGVIGAVIGVTDMDRSVNFYVNILGIDTVVYDRTGAMEDKPHDDDPRQVYRRVLLSKAAAKEGAFSRLLGDVQIELIEVKDSAPKKIFSNRYWGDCGFIHLCFDVINMDGLKQHSQQQNINFSVDSADSFAMGNSAGRFCYMEDPDNTLIELVETHKVPIYKKFGLYINLKKRKSNKPLPDWIVGLLGLNKIK